MSDADTPAPTPAEPHGAHGAPHGFDLVAGILAFVFPGLGHVYLGQARRGVLAMAGVLGLFFGGMLIGGIDAIDAREDRLWFIGQALVGPAAFGVDWIHQNHFKAWGVPLQPAPGQSGELVLRSAAPGERVEIVNGRRTITGRDPDARPAAMKSVAKVNEIGTLYATIGGMVNLIVILDALFPALDRPRRRSAGGAR